MGFFDAADTEILFEMKCLRSSNKRYALPVATVSKESRYTKKYQPRKELVS